MNKKMKKIINHFKIINSRTLFALGVLATSFFALPLMAYGVFTPGETLDPTTCSPTSTGCTVTTPAVSGANTDITSLGGTLYVNSSTNKIGIGISNPGADLDIAGTHNIYLNASASSTGELLAGISIGGYSNTNMYLSPSFAGTVGNKLQLGYYNGAEWLSALEYAHSDGGSGTYSDLYLLKAGGNVGVNTGSNAPLASLHVGDRNLNNSVDTTILASRTIDSGTGNAHGFSDSSNFARTSTVAYASYDGRINVTGITDFDEIISFKDEPTINVTGTLATLYGGASVPSLAHGTITNRYGWYSGDVGVTGGTVANNYGVYVAGLSSGTNNYAVYTTGDTQSYFGGKVGIGTSTPDKLFTVWGDSRLNGDLFDVNNSAGTVGQILTATADGVDWENPTAGALYDATVCSGGCDYISIATALTGEGDNKSIRVFRGTYIESSNVLPQTGQNIYFDDVIIQMADSYYFYVNEVDVNLEGILEVQGAGLTSGTKILFGVGTGGGRLNTSNLKLTVAPTGDGLNHDMEMNLLELSAEDCVLGDIIMRDFTMAESGTTVRDWNLVNVDGENNIWKNLFFKDIIFTNSDSKTINIFNILASSTQANVLIKTVTGNTLSGINPEINGIHINSTVNYCDIRSTIKSITTNSINEGTGIVVDAGATQNAIRGVSYSNDKSNFSDSGTGTNFTGLISP